MLNVIELENRWKKYKIKSYMPHIVIMLSVLLISIIGYSFISLKNKQETKLPVSITEPLQEKSVNQNSNIIRNTIENNTSHLKITDTPATVHVVKEIPQLTQDETTQIQKLTLTPSLNFINEMNNDLPYYQSSNKNDEKQQNNFVETESSQIKTNKEFKEEIKEQEEEKVQSIKIQRKDTHEDILQVIKRFKKSNDPALSLFVAKKYYELGDFHKSYNYALITNELNNNIEASWIIFAKSLVKLNEQEMAVKTLRQYIEHSGSNQAKLLLEEIRSGKFK